MVPINKPLASPNPVSETPPSPKRKTSQELVESNAETVVDQDEEKKKKEAKKIESDTQRENEIKKLKEAT